MRYRIKVSDAREPHGWWEDQNKPQVNSLADAERSGKGIVSFYNSTLRPGELPRTFLAAEMGREEPCPDCDGTDTTDCEECEGNGWVEDPSDGGTMTCPECGGGCRECDSTGKVVVYGRERVTADEKGGAS